MIEARHKSTGRQSMVGPGDDPRLTPSLSYLASRAAIELDNLIQGKGSTQGSSAIDELIKALSDSPLFSLEEGTRNSLADPGSVELLNRTFGRLAGEAPPRTLQALSEKAREVVEALARASSPAEPEVLVRMRDFCLALSQAARISSQAKHEDLRPRHPYRK